MIFGTTKIDIFSDLLLSLKELTRLTIIQEEHEHVPFAQTEKACPALSQSVQDIAASANSAPISVDAKMVIEKWNQYQTNPTENRFTGRDCKRFCWVPEIVFSADFRSLVSKKEIPITLPSLRGLVYSYHANFNELCTDRQFNNAIWELISVKSAANASVARWRDALDCIVGEKAPYYMARQAFEKLLAPQQQLEELELSTTTSFARLFAQELVELISDKFEKIDAKKLSNILNEIFGSQLVNREAFKTSLSGIILSRRALESEEVQALLVDFLLRSDGIGDPRIHPENWVGIRDDAKQQVIQWLSREDINFFFELLLRDRDDKHGRKSFWLKYVEKISRSRAFVAKDDLHRHSVRLREMSEKGRSYGELTGSNVSSAFVLDFGRIVVVEFSEVNNACYIYKKEAFTEVLKEFWAKEIPSSVLKNKELVAERITRSMKDWQGSARQILSRFGVRT